MQHEVRLRRRRAGRSETLAIHLTAGKTLMDAALDAGLPIASACGRDQLCARCGLQILEGREYVSAESPKEAEVKLRNRIAPALRLACLARITGPVEVTASYW
ncbi:MAG: (2Fe-2S)-binding protein [Deltaproteobacteria bacterium]|nr:(2Fe-2S)-binding protein [Deltaproteobacteria bacterium]MBW2395568.1 (2Fe-2S)-binding protein [Deltaproteobacteria bacterium]